MDGHACYNAPLPVNVAKDQSQCNTGSPLKYVKPTEVASNPNSQPETPSVLFIGDSISANIDLDLLARATKAEFCQAKAYSSVKATLSSVWKNAAKFPNSNFTKKYLLSCKKELFN